MNIINLSFKNVMNKFINMLTTKEIEIKRAFNDYYNTLLETEEMKNMAKEINFDMKKFSFFKNNKMTLHLDINREETSKICNSLKDIFNCRFILLDLKNKDYKKYLLTVGKRLDSWLTELFTDNINTDYIDKIYYTSEDFLSMNNILQVIQYNFNKYFNH